MGALADPSKDVGKIASDLMDSVGNVIDNLMPVIESVAERLPQVIPVISAKIREMAPRLLPAAQSLLSSVFNGVSQLLIDLTPELISGLSSALVMVINSLPTLIPKVISTAFKLFVAIVTAVRNAAPQILGAIGNVMGQAIQAISSRVGQILAPVRNMTNNVYQQFRSLPSRITSALGNLGSLLYGAGKSIMQGLLNGITAGWKWIQDKVSGMGSWIASHKGPESYDKKLLVPNGGWIMDGLMQGIDNALPQLRKQLQGVTDTIQGTDLTVSSSLGSAAQVAKVGGSTNYTVYINGTQINNDSQIEGKFIELMNAMARKGMM